MPVSSPLPLDLLHLIISDLHSHHDRPVFAALRRVNRAFYDITTPILYSDIVFSSKGVDGLLPITLQRSSSTESHASDNYYFNMLVRGSVGLSEHYSKSSVRDMVQRAKADRTFWLPSFSTTRRLWNLQYAVTLRLEDLPCNHPFWGSLVNALPSPDPWTAEGYAPILPSIRNLVITQGFLFTIPIAAQIAHDGYVASHQTFRRAMERLCGSNIQNLCCAADVPETDIVDALLGPRSGSRPSLTIHDSVDMAYCHVRGIDRTISSSCILFGQGGDYRDRVQALFQEASPFSRYWRLWASKIGDILIRGDRVDAVLDIRRGFGLPNVSFPLVPATYLKREVFRYVAHTSSVRREVEERFAVVLKGEKTCNACGQLV